MAMTMSRRPWGVGGSVSQTHRDITEDRYRDLRHPRRVKFFCNGDRYFQGKLIHITPHRYLTFNDLLNDLTAKLPSSVHLPYGVRNIYTPVTGQRIRDIEEFQDGQNYVCGGFEAFRPIKYGGREKEPWAPVGKPHNHDFFSDLYSPRNAPNPPTLRYGYNAFYPQRQMRGSYPRRNPPGTFGSRAGQGSYWGATGGSHDVGGAMKPKVITVIRNSDRPRDNVKILLNRRSVQSYEQLMKDISEAFGPKWKNSKVKRLFSLKGREVQSVSDFFREDDVFLGVGASEVLTYNDIQDILEEMYPDNPYAQTLVKEWDKNKRRQRVYILKKDREDGKKDSGLGSDSSNKDDDGNDVFYKGKNYEKPKKQSEEEALRLEKERQKASDAEREKARRRMLKRREAERKALEEERRKKGMIPLKPLNESKKEDDNKEHYKSQKEPTDDAPKVIVVVKDGDGLKSKNKSPRKNTDGYESDSEDLPKEEDKPKKTEKTPVPKEVLKEEDEEEIRNDVIKEHSQVLSIVKEDTQVTSNDKEQTEKTSNEKEQTEITIDSQEKEQTLPKPDDNDNEKHVEIETPKTETHISDPEKEKTKPDDVNKSTTEMKEEPEKKRTEFKDERPKTPSSKGRALSIKEKTKNKEDDAKNKKKPGNKIIRKTKLERQISNMVHVLNKYEPGKVLGDGNFAVVKQCKLKNTKSEYAMKVIDKAKLKGKENMIENEIEIMKLCNHTNIVKLMEEFETKEEIYLIMELVKGGDLFDAITQSVKFGERESAGMTLDLVQALFYLHSRHIVHRDLKPENLLVCRNKDGTITLKLADFGLAMEVTENIYTVCGTPTYVAPEILSEIGYGLEVDMWACGVITYILLCGFPPFRSPDRNQTELFEFIKAGEYEFLAPYWDGISRSAKDLIEHLLVVDRKKRYSAIDTLCHPWVITKAGAIKSPGNLEEYRKTRRSQLETEAKANRESFLRTKYGDD